ncbi:MULTISPECIES: bifunctional riboflavin kinase/FAD synthetase [Thiomicrorhabdus]|uniref:Riboflavin biosynthesis protein n=1 Tax=Thiomicrorhabdus heinhorstiae TaxID=2748010 RepID=A0ABS0BZW6_9GAMM|nr:MULTISPECIES: bifunctional riboflavin kinase/FAD synthetase [Thiomicrorhabdus]MBF6058595.1 bifunctional riboflavin kinase/FAD synthetase [Thiomicrorhabdus heinhorstiae]
MQLIRGLHNLSACQKRFFDGCILTIGNFDGIHLGHQQVLKALCRTAKQTGLPTVVMIFEPLPIEYFSPQSAPDRLMNLREKLQAFADTQIDYVLCMPFNADFANLTAQEFVKQVLVDALNIKHLVIGDDFRFGKGRLGDYAFLQEAGESFGFSVTDMPTFCREEERVSSTRIRAALQKPDLAEAQRLLGRPFSFNGRVIHGQKLGRTIGFPTLNLNPKRIQMPVMGVFAVWVDGIADRPWPGVANIGLRPTVDGVRPSIEVHLFDWDQDLYGRHIDVNLAYFIRPEMKFDGLEALKQQIAQDAEQARAFFAAGDD